MPPSILPPTISLPPTLDMHVHLRDGAMMKLCTPQIRPGGASTVYLMPNLQPPLTSLPAIESYLSSLHPLSPSTTFLPTLYLHPSLTPSTIAAAASAGIRGIKAYPQGVTTNSTSGVSSWPSFYPIFAAMQTHGLVLNIHGEEPTSSVLTAETDFLPTLLALHARFPGLKIVLEHATTAAALGAVARCGGNVGVTITAHHLWMTIDDVVGNVDNYCKPLAKTEGDRRALIRSVVGGWEGKLRERVMFGSDSAPHDVGAKRGRSQSGGGCCSPTAAAGCFTQGWTTQLVVGAVDQALCEGWLLEDEPQLKDGEMVVDALKAFLSGNARRFYGLGDDGGERIVLERGKGVIPMAISEEGGEGLVVNCFRGGERTWGLRWVGEGGDENET